jgi:hypothetical protein
VSQVGRELRSRIICQAETYQLFPTDVLGGFIRLTAHTTSQPLKHIFHPNNATKRRKIINNRDLRLNCNYLGSFQNFPSTLKILNLWVFLRLFGNPFYQRLSMHVIHHSSPNVADGTPQIPYGISEYS